MRETASLGEMLDEILARVERGVRAVRSAVIVNGSVMRARGLRSTRSRNGASRRRRSIIEATSARPSDRVFPIRTAAGAELGRRGADRLSAGRPAARRLGSQPRRAEGARRRFPRPIARAVRTVIKREAREAQVAGLIADNCAPDRRARGDAAARGRRRKRPRGTG